MHPWARERFEAARVARLATVSSQGRPHLVPIVFAVTGDVVWTAVDDKPKTTRSLRRLANIGANPRVSLLVDHYDDDWAALWWVRVDGHATATSVEEEHGRTALDALAEKYPQYAVARPPGPLIRVVVDAWSSWSA